MSMAMYRMCALVAFANFCNSCHHDLFRDSSKWSQSSTAFGLLNSGAELTVWTRRFESLAMSPRCLPTKDLLAHGSIAWFYAGLPRNLEVISKSKSSDWTPKTGKHCYQTRTEDRRVTVDAKYMYHSCNIYSMIWCSLMFYNMLNNIIMYIFIDDYFRMIGLTSYDLIYWHGKKS